MQAKKARRSRLVGIGAIAALCAWLIPAGTALAAPAPAWQILAFSYATNFAPGSVGTESKTPGYTVTAQNVGGEETSGKFTITDTLPAGVSVSPLAAPQGVYGPEFDSHKLKCESSGQTVSCSSEDSLHPGEVARIVVPVEVSPSATGTLLDEASVEGGAAVPVSTTAPTPVSSEIANFGFLVGPPGAYGSATKEDGSPATLAGSHPYQLTVGMGFASDPTEESGGTLHVPGGGVRDISGELPQGVVVNPEAAPKCTEVQLEGNSQCPDATQIGTIRIPTSISADEPAVFYRPLFNMVAPPGVVAELGFEAIDGTYVHLLGRVRSGGDYGLSADVRNIPAKIGIVGSEVRLWGSPSDESHDYVRGLCIQHEIKEEVETKVFERVGCETERLDTAFLSMPGSCSEEPLDTFLHMDNWVGEEADTSYPSADLNGNPVGVDGCNSLEFEPSIEARPTTNLADSPSGLDFNLHQHQEMKVSGRSPANLKDTAVSLPAGMVLNPSAGDGLGGCTEAQLDQHNPVPSHCPDSSKIGSVEVKTPLLENSLEGAVYLAQPFENPFGSLLAIYIAVEDPLTGVVAKLPGKVTADPVTGQLTTTVEESPELPLEDVALHLFTGPRAALTTPPACGEYTTTSDLTPWSTPERADAHPIDTFATTVSPNGAACPSNAGEAANKPAFSAGTISPQAGAYSPFVLKISREDGTQRIAGIDTTMPKGLTGKLAGIPYCPESGIAQAVGRTRNGDGALERQSPSCTKASEVGTADIAAGSGITPLHTAAHAYLAGPYKGAPLSVVVITPAVAGPFDLGVVTTRVALYVDPETAKIHAVSDPLPQILDGIPLDVRSIALELGRPSFTLNPTSCDPSAVGGTATSALGVPAALSSPFQVGGCGALPFKPKLQIKLKGGTKRGDFPSLTATATAKPGEANIGRVSVELPHSAFLEQSHIGTVCTRVQFAQGSVPGEKCPARSIYGKASLTTPLLDQPLAGPVFLRSSSHQLPDLVVALHGQVDVVVAGKVDSVKGALRNTFEAVPDAPFSKFTLQMRGGKKGLIVNSRNLCAAANKATVQMDGQNGKAFDSTPVVKAKCGGKAPRGKKGHKKR
jgi:hypothetical protein